MFTRAWCKAAAERAVKSAAQAGLVVWGVVKLTSVHDVVPAGEATGLAMLAGGVLSLLTSLASTAVSGGSPSITDAEVLPES